MATQTPTPQVPQTALYMLIAAKLGRDPLAFIRERRAQDPPVPFAKIADEIKKATDVYVTHEVPRRWFNAAAADEAA